MPTGNAVWLAAASCVTTLLLTLTGAADPVCRTKLNSCSCETVSGGKIDLSPLAATGSVFPFSARFPPKPDYDYMFNPCQGLRCDTSSGDAAACQRSVDGKHEYLLGTQSTAEFDTQPDVGLHLTFNALSGDSTRRAALVQLVCDSSGGDHFESLDDGRVGPPPILYRMRLTSKHCCEKFGGGGGDGGLSGGDILLIVFFCLVLLYVAGGVAFNVLARGQRPGPDALPNPQFWTAMPGLVRDGALFTFTRIRAVFSRRTEYENI